MSAKEKTTFVIYSSGEKPDVLRLGNLVLRDYVNPTLSNHYISKPPSPEEEDTDISRIALGPSVFHQKAGWHAATALDAFELAEFGIHGSNEGDIILAASTGERVTLKDPQLFLNEHVLIDELARKLLTLWTSAASLRYVQKRLAMRTPKIWLCTGVYVLQGVEVYRVTGLNAGAKVGASSSLIAALGAAPLGPSLSFGLTKMSSAQVSYPQQLVWAAQWGALDVKYVRSSCLPSSMAPEKGMKLLPDVFSKGALRADNDRPDAIQLPIAVKSVETRGDKVPQNMADTVTEGPFDDEIGRLFNEAISELQEYYDD